MIFDVDNNKLGIARAVCNEDPHQIKSEAELIVKGQALFQGFDPLNRSESKIHNINFNR